MAYGARILNESGRVLLDTSITTWNYIASGLVGPGQQASGDISAYGLNEAIIMQFLVNDTPTNQEAIAHTETVSRSSYAIGGGNQLAVFVVLGR